jgi:hypothetical protein
VLVDSSHEDQNEGFRKADKPGLTREQFDLLFVEPSLAIRRQCIAAARETPLAPGSELYEKCLYPAVPQFGKAVQEIENRQESTSAFQRTQHSEEEAFMRASAQQVRAIPRGLGNLPLIVLSRDRFPPPENATPEQLERMEAQYQVWLTLARDLTSLSNDGLHRIVAGAGHDIQIDRPQAVIDAVREVLAKSHEVMRASQ